MLKKLIALVIISLFFMNFAIPGAKAAETFVADQFPYKEMQVQIMPEFDYPEKWPKDQPSLLVGYYGTFINKTGKAYSGEIEFPIPAQDKNFEMYLLAEFPAEDKPEIQRPFEINRDKGVVTWKPSKPIENGKEYRFVVEYYFNPFKAADLKTFTYDFVNPADIEKLDMIVYAPLGSKDFKISPIATNTSESDYGEKLYIYQYKDVKKDGSVKLDVSYVKKDNNSTLSAISAKQPPKDDNHAGVGGKSATEQVNNNSDRPIIGLAGASIIGISIIIAALFIFLGLKGNTLSAKSNATIVNNHKKASKKAVIAKQAKVGKKDSTDEKKQLRTRLLSGEIDESTYEKELKKLG